MEYLTLHNAGIILALLGGIGAHIIKKVVTRRESDGQFSLGQFLRENPYKTAMTFFYGSAGLLGAYAIGEVSIYNAVLLGFSANSLSGASDR